MFLLAFKAQANKRWYKKTVARTVGLGFGLVGAVGYCLELLKS